MKNFMNYFTSLINVARHLPNDARQLCHLNTHRPLRFCMALSLVLVLVGAMWMPSAYAVNEQLDPTFGGGDGMVTTDFFGNSDYANDIAIQSDGKIVVVGYSWKSNNGPNFAVARYLTDGTLDPSFGSGGKATYSILYHIVLGGDEVANAVAIQTDGKIVVAGKIKHMAVNTPSYDFALIRLNTNGTLDTTFGSDGKVWASLSTGDDIAHDVVIQPDGKIVAVGVADDRANNGKKDFALVRYNTNGTLDTSFSGDGKELTNFSSGIDHANAVALQLDGKIVVAGGTRPIEVTGGTSPSFGPTKFALARYNTNGSLDGAFSSDGKVTTRFMNGSCESASDVAIQSDGKIVAAGGSFGSCLARYNTNGSLNASFDGDGKVHYDSSYQTPREPALVIQADGKIVAAGWVGDVITCGISITLARYNANGSLDPSFGSGGIIKTEFSGGQTAFGLAIQSDGKLVTAGYSGCFNYDFALTRYLPSASGAAYTPATPKSTSAILAPVNSKQPSLAATTRLRL